MTFTRSAEKDRIWRQPLSNTAASTPSAEEARLTGLHFSFTNPQHWAPILTPVKGWRGRRDLHCPACSARTLQRYGRTGAGKQRCLCVRCGRQFTLLKTRREIKTKPNCPKCKTPMHLYRREAQILRFRCAKYPQCRTYIKAARPKEDGHE